MVLDDETKLFILIALISLSCGFAVVPIPSRGRLWWIAFGVLLVCAFSIGVVFGLGLV